MPYSNSFFRVSLFFFIVFISHKSRGQIGIGTTLPNESSILHIESSNKGLLIPQIALSDTVDNTTISSAGNNLIVFNTSTTGGLTVGLYYWSTSSSRWNPVTDVMSLETMVIDADTDDGLSIYDDTLGYNINTGNGLALVADSVGLGGVLSQPTTITTSATNTLALEGLQAGNTSALSLVIDTASGAIGLEPVKTISIHPEFPGAVLYDEDEDPTNSEGTMMGTFSTSLMDNLYQWTTTSTDVGGEEYRISFMWTAPSDFTEWNPSGTNINFTNTNSVTINPSTVSGTTVISGSGTSFTASTGAPGDILRFEIIMNATNVNTATVGTVNFSFR